MAPSSNWAQVGSSTPTAAKPAQAPSSAERQFVSAALLSLFVNEIGGTAVILPGELLIASETSIEEAYNRLISEGIDVTPIKEGLKENTLVATIKSHTHNVPTLLIEHTQ